jgi:hypothetical protein
LQDETGRAIGALNVDDEPLPAFVHDVAPMLVGLPGRRLSKAVPYAHPMIVMRLETPVVYFHPAAGKALPKSVDLRVRFRGGWLNQFYPDAEFASPNLKIFESEGKMRRYLDTRSLDGKTVSSLCWEGLKLGGAVEVPETDAHVWLAPRNVKALSVATRNGEAEAHLFYRGVGHVEAPIRLARDDSGSQYIIHANLPSELAVSEPLLIPDLWLVQILADGQTAYRRFGPLSLSSDDNQIVAAIPAEFAVEDFQEAKIPDTEKPPMHGNLFDLRHSMHRALVREGLFADEADAMLNTWEASYFKSAGLRLFFIIPRAWIDHILPLDVSVPAQIERVMVGRIELVTPGQRALLRTLDAIQSDPAAINQPETQDVARFIRHRLGRFADALVLDQTSRQNPALSPATARVGP